MSRRSIILIAAAIVLAPVAWFWHGWRGTTPNAPSYTVASGEKSYPTGVSQTFGYAVKKFVGRRSGFKVEIHAYPSLKLSLDIGDFELDRVKTQRWLARDSAILLELEYVGHDSIDDFFGELSLLYDFERGELHTFEHGSAWFVWPNSNHKSRSLTRAEFDNLIQSLSQQVPTR